MEVAESEFQGQLELEQALLYPYRHFRGKVLVLEALDPPKEVVLLHSLTAGVEFLFVLIVPLTVVFAFATYGFYPQDLFLVVLVLRVL